MLTTIPEVAADRTTAVTFLLPPDQASTGRLNAARMLRSLVRADRIGPITLGRREWKMAMNRVSDSTFSSKITSASANDHCGRACGWLSIFTASAGTFSSSGWYDVGQRIDTGHARLRRVRRPRRWHEDLGCRIDRRRRDGGRGWGAVVVVGAGRVVVGSGSVVVVLPAESS